MIATTDDIRAELVSLKDEKYAEFQSKLIPEVSRERVIGVRTPALKELAKRLSGTEAANAFLQELPHRYFDEDQLHAFIVSGIKNYDNCLFEIGSGDGVKSSLGSEKQFVGLFFNANRHVLILFS